MVETRIILDIGMICSWSDADTCHVSHVSEGPKPENSS
jgi:hypothetical protein